MRKTKKGNRKKWLTWREHRKELLKDPKVFKALQELQPELAIIRKIIQARLEEGITEIRFLPR